MANLKVLIAAASSALERESASSGRSGDGTDGGTGGDDVGGRKMKSLSVLCQRYMYSQSFSFSQSITLFMNSVDNKNSSGYQSMTL